MVNSIIGLLTAGYDRMTCYIITFEIGAEANVQRVHERIKTLGTAYCPIHKNCWAVLAETTEPITLIEQLQQISPGDRFFVIRSGTKAAWLNTYGEAWSQWLKNNL